MDYAIPPGLEYLTQLDQVLVQQLFEALEMCCNWEMNNKYLLKNNLGQQFLRAVEDTDCCTRQCCGPLRDFQMQFLDNNDREVMHLSRPLACTGCCCPCCLQSIEVFAPPGTLIGTIHQEWSFCTPMAGKFTVRNVSGDTVLRLQGPLCAISCGSDVDFKVLTADEDSQIGNVTKQWRGCCAEAFTDTDSFGVTFPKDMDVRTKALLIGSMFLIDFMYFERGQQR